MALCYGLREETVCRGNDQSRNSIRLRGRAEACRKESED
jgi:hypothetical protein